MDIQLHHLHSPAELSPGQLLDAQNLAENLALRFAAGDEALRQHLKEH